MRLVNIEIHNFIRELLPSFLRGGKLEVLLNCFLNPLKILFKEFLIWRDLRFLRANTTGQTIKLENYLNIMLKGDATVEIIHTENPHVWYLPLEEEGFIPKGLGLKGEDRDILLSLEKDEISFTEDFKVITKMKMPIIGGTWIGLQGENKPLYMGKSKDPASIPIVKDIKIINDIDRVIKEFNITNKKYSIKIV